MTDLVVEPAVRAPASEANGCQRGAGGLFGSREDVSDPAVAEAWRLEIRRRAAAYERGEATLFDADEVMADAKRLAR